ncbi:MAG: hypothetical protein ACKV2T_31155 [Kofleriaceae bacterium]
MATLSFQKLPQAYKFSIGNLYDGNDITVEAQFNPKELQIDSPISWREHQAIGRKSFATKPMEFDAMGAETVKVELLFDAYEESSDYVMNAVAALKSLASVDEARKMERPSYCVAKWGEQNPFPCVIESISVKYTMFMPNGMPVRATVTLGLKSAMRPKMTGDETTFEIESRKRLERQRDAYAVARGRRESERQREATVYAHEERERARRYEEAQRANTYDRDLAAREANARAEREQLAAKRSDAQREIEKRNERIARERAISEQQRANDAEREQQRIEREKRKSDFGLE